MKKGEKLLFLAGILLAIGALAFSAWKLRGIYGEYQEGEDTYEELASFVEEPEDTPKPDGGEPDAEPDGYLKIDFEGLQAVNPDVIAWIDIPAFPLVIRWYREPIMLIICIICLPGSTTAAAVSLRTGITSRILRIRTPLYTATI